MTTYVIMIVRDFNIHVEIHHIIRVYQPIVRHIIEHNSFFSFLIKAIIIFEEQLYRKE